MKKQQNAWAVLLPKDRIVEDATTSGEETTQKELVCGIG
jgi:hypothetical protein